MHVLGVELLKEGNFNDVTKKRRCSRYSHVLHQLSLSLSSRAKERVSRSSVFKSLQESSSFRIYHHVPKSPDSSMSDRKMLVKRRMKVVSKKPQMAPVVSRLGENPLFMSDTSG
jgi:hypothetical protein